MSRHIECDNLILLAISLKVNRVVTFVPIKDQKAIGPVDRLAIYRLKCFSHSRPSLLSVYLLGDVAIAQSSGRLFSRYQLAR
jgi:hypothetical protein